MKKLVLLSVAALMLASSVFAPVAMAQEPGDVEIQSVTLEPDAHGLWTVTGTIQCTEGDRYDVAVAIFWNIKPGKNLLKKLQKFNLHSYRDINRGVSVTTDLGDCETTGPQSFTLGLIPFPLTNRDQVWVVAAGRVCGFSQGEFICNADQTPVKKASNPSSTNAETR